MTMHRLALAALAAAALVGCSTTKLDEAVKAPVENRSADAVKPPPVVQQPQVPDSRVTTVDLATELTKTVADKRVVYFDFDSFIVKDEYAGLVDAHAKRLTQIKTQSLMLEGHTDQRGSREYNLALGQKRAEAVLQRLSLAGVTGAQAEPVSFGKERLAMEGSGEAVWAKNRRVELKDK